MKWIVVLGAVCVTGCSVPDGDDITDLEQSITLDVVTPEMRVWAANRYTAGYVRGLAGSLEGMTLGWVECPGHGRMRVEVGDMLRCLTFNQQSLYAECLSRLLESVKRALVPESHEGSCYWDSYMYGFAPEELPDECEPDNNETARAILDAVLGHLPDAPPLHIQMMMVGGGLFGPLGVLCPLDKRGCPGVPWELPGATPGGSSGGDR